MALGESKHHPLGARRQAEVGPGGRGLALGRNLLLLEPGRPPQTWAAIALLVVVGLYALAARLFRRARFAWLAAVLVVAPWTILTHLGWFVLPEPPRLPAYALAWLALAWLLLSLGLLLEQRGARRHGLAPRVVAHVLVPFSLLWCVADVPTAYIAWGLGVAFYAVSAVVDHARLPGRVLASRFIYPAAGLAPVWALYLRAQFVPTAQHLDYGLVLLAFGPAGLLAGVLLRRTPHGSPADAYPAYLTATGSALVGTLLVAHDRPWLIAALLLDAALCAVSAWYHKEPLWGYPAAAFPIAALWLALAHYDVDPNRHGWALIALGAAYLAVAHALRQIGQIRYTQCPAGGVPLMAVAYVAVALGLPPSSRDYDGALVGYGGAALVYGLSAIWLKQPLFLTPALALATVPYGVALHRSPAPVADYGLWLWPGIAAALAVAHALDAGLGAPREFPWREPDRWLPAVAERWLDTWPALPFYVAGYVGAVVSVGLSWVWGSDMLHVAAALALTAIAYGLATYRFRLRAWLLAAGAVAQLAALALIDHTVGLFAYSPRSALAFLPVTAVTALAALLVERRRGEGSPIILQKPVFWEKTGFWAGWSRPLYLLAVLDLAYGQLMALDHSDPGTLVTLGHAVLVAVLASAWAWPAAMAAAAGLGVLALVQGLDWYRVPADQWPVALALLALAYGVVGSVLTISRRRQVAIPRWLPAWANPLTAVSLVMTLFALLMVVGASAGDLAWLVVRALIVEPAVPAYQMPAVQTTVAVLAVVGLLYLAVALAQRWRWLGYGATALLLAAYGLEALLLWGQREVQWYAIPAGVYLLGMGYLEWRTGDRRLARAIDWTALVLLFGSAFWQSLAHTGAPAWGYALLMAGEGLAVALLWGSIRRLRRFLYSGVAAVVLAFVGQLVNLMTRSFSSLGTALALGVVGLLLLLLALLVEWRLEAVRQRLGDLGKRLEDWE